MLKVKGDHGGYGGCHNSHPLENSRRVGQNRLVWYRQDRAGPSHPPASFASMGTGSRVSCPHFSHTRLMIRAEAVMRTSAEKSLELRRRTRPSAESLHAIPPSPSSLIPLVARNKSRCWARPNHDQVVPEFVLKPLLAAAVDVQLQSRPRPPRAPFAMHPTLESPRRLAARLLTQL
jgi:hypothetical protein